MQWTGPLSPEWPQQWGLQLQLGPLQWHP
jgi:hypothetical protein